MIWVSWIREKFKWNSLSDRRIHQHILHKMNSILHEKAPCSDKSTDKQAYKFGTLKIWFRYVENLKYLVNNNRLIDRRNDNLLLLILHFRCITTHSVTPYHNKTHIFDARPKVIFILLLRHVDKTKWLRIHFMQMSLK